MPASEEAAVEVGPNTMVTNNVVRYIRINPNITFNLSIRCQLAGLSKGKSQQVSKLDNQTLRRVLDNST